MFPSVVGRLVASPSHTELHASGHGISRTLSQDLLNSVAVLLSIVMVRSVHMGSIVQGHMFTPDVGLTRTQVTPMPLDELSGAYLDTVGVLTNPPNHSSGVNQVLVR